MELVVNSDDSLGYKLDGADTVHPFSNYKKLVILDAQTTGAHSGSIALKASLPKLSKKVVISISNYNYYNKEPGINHCTIGGVRFNSGTYILEEYSLAESTNCPGTYDIEYESQHYPQTYGALSLNIMAVF